MELVSRLAREPWTDRPACVHPVLGAIARAVHDHSTPAGRRELLPLAPHFLNTNTPGAEPAARLVALCTSTALATADPGGAEPECGGPVGAEPGGGRPVGGETARGRPTADELRRLGAAHRTALHLLGADEQPDGMARLWLPVLGRWGEPFYRTFIATEQAAEAVAVTARTAGDVPLRNLLKQCLATQGALRPRPSCSASAQKAWS